GAQLVDFVHDFPREHARLVLLLGGWFELLPALAAGRNPAAFGEGAALVVRHQLALLQARLGIDQVPDFPERPGAVLGPEQPGADGIGGNHPDLFHCNPSGLASDDICWPFYTEIIARTSW